MADVPVQSRRGLIKIQPRKHTPIENRSTSINLTMGPNELQRLLDRDQFNNSSSFLFGNSTTIGNSGFFGDNASISERSMVEMNSEQLQKHNMFRAKSDMLFPQFLEILQARTNDSEVFDTIQDLIHTCSGILDDNERDVRRRNGESVWLEEELKTWKLLYALYKDRIMLQGESVDCEIAPLGGSEKEVIAQLYTCNSTLREYQLIVDWLEACYVHRDNGPQVGHSTDAIPGWENTLFQLQNEQPVAFASKVEIVKSLDPDAPIREKRPLHPLDEEDNARLSRCIFEEIRQGHIDEAMALCKYCGQTWRAAILEGWRLHEDPNYEAQNVLNTKEKMPIEGNPRRDIWKKCAWMMADSKQYDEYTRAIAGAFCGHLESLKALLTSSWEDLLWAYLKVQIDIRVESEIRSCCLKQYLQMPDEYWNLKMSMEQIFDELAVHNDAAVRDCAKSKVGTIQKLIILDNVTDLLLEMRRWVDNDGDGNVKLSSQMLRFLSHIVLFMRQVGRIDKEEAADRIISAYVETLIEMGDPQLVAFYTAALPTKLQTQLYSKFLENITETAARSTALEEAMNAGLDVETINYYTVENIRVRFPDDSTKPIKSDKLAASNTGKLKVGEISEFNKEKIHALEWLTFLPAQRGDLLWQTNAMIRTFLAEGEPECVRAAFNMVPPDSLSQIMSIYGSRDNFPSREECSIKEYLCYKVYLTATDSFEEWSHLYHNPPKEPQLPSNSGINFTERVACEHKEQVYRAELQRWKTYLEEQTKVSTDALYNVLLFPEKGWLIDPDIVKEPSNISPTDWENRQIQLNKLRSICIPEVTLLLHKILHSSGDFQACIKIADEIADESRQLYKVYTKHKMAELLSKIAESSLELLNKKLDPWGYELTV